MHWLHPSDCDDIPKKRFKFLKCNRILTSAQFSKVFSEGKRFFSHGILLTARLLVAEPLQPISKQRRLGFALSRRSLKLASQRKRFKRLAIEFFRQNQEILPVGEFVLSLTHAFQPERLHSFSDLSSHFRGLWQKAAESEAGKQRR